MKMTILKTIAFLLFIPFCGLAQIQLEKKSLLDNKIELLVPTNFTVMTPEMLAFKYHSANKPQIVFTNEDADVNLVVSLMPQPMQESQVGLFKDFQLATLKKSRPDAKFLSDGVKKINNKNVGYFKFISAAVDQNVFNYYFFTSLDGKVLLLSFNCTEKLLPKWEDAAESIVSSLRVK